VWEINSQGEIFEYLRHLSTVTRHHFNISLLPVLTIDCSPVPFGVQEWKARISIKTLDSAVEPHVAQDARKSTALRPYLCYACHTTLASRSSRGAPAILKQTSGTPLDTTGTITLPVWAQDRLRDSTLGRDNGFENELESKQRVTPDAMRAAISDYLLD
jgi:hypothetical protein